MNDIIQSLFARKSTRSFETTPIAESDKTTLVEAAIQAPTAGNQALYTILEIDDQALKDELAVLCDNQPFIAKAPYVVIFLADCRRWLDCYAYAGVTAREPGMGDMLLSCADALIAAQNMVVAAEALGIGSCYIGDILENKEKVAARLDLDAYVVPIAMLVFGYPTEQQKQREKPRRFEAKYLVQKNTYTRPTEQSLRSMFAAMHPEPSFEFDTYITKFCERKYMSSFAVELSRSAKEYAKAFLVDE